MAKRKPPKIPRSAAEMGRPPSLTVADPSAGADPLPKVVGPSASGYPAQGATAAGPSASPSNLPPQRVIPSPAGPSAAIATPSPSDPASMPLGIEPPLGILGIELGRTGLAQYWGRIAEEFLPELSYERGRKVFREMADNDPTVGALITAIMMLVRSVSWRVESEIGPKQLQTFGKRGTQAAKGDPRAAFIASCMDDMDHTWNDLMAEIMRGNIVWGWSLHELVYKTRQKGDSEFDDGQIGWKKMPLRAQESLWRWDFDGNQVLRGMFQRPPPDFVERYIPLEKSLLFRLDTFKGNPEGRSLLRNAYRPWYFKKFIEQLEAIGVERDLAGIPVITAPAAFFSANPPTGSGTVLAALKKIAVSIKQDEQTGIVMPQAFDPDTKQPLYKLELLHSGGAKQFNTSEIITRWDVRLLVTMLVDFIIQGHDQVGSFSMTKAKIDFFNMALGAWMDSIGATFNRYAVRRLLELNGMDTEDPPYLVHGTVERRDLQQLGDFLNKLAMSGMPLFPNPKIENALLEMADLPTMSPEEVMGRMIEDQQQEEANARREAQATGAESQGRGGALDTSGSSNTGRGGPTDPNTPGGSASPGQRPNAGRGVQPAPTTAKPPVAKAEDEMADLMRREEMRKSAEAGYDTDLVFQVPPPVIRMPAPQIHQHFDAEAMGEAISAGVSKAMREQKPPVINVTPVNQVESPTVHVTATVKADDEGIKKQASAWERFAKSLEELAKKVQRPKTLRVERDKDGKLKTIKAEEE